MWTIIIQIAILLNVLLAFALCLIVVGVYGLVRRYFYRP